MEKEIFQVETENKTVSCEVLYRFYLEKYQKHYLVYKECLKEDPIFVSSYNPNDATYTLFDITNEKELEDIIRYVETRDN